jgi:hypothetical protein|nr:MAG TPA: hypothetical protein [Caudoviricetes sp.]
MRITVKPPSPAPSPPLPAGALLTVRVEAADPAPLLAGPPSVAYEGRYADTPTPGAFLFPGKDPAPGVSTTAPAASDFRTPFATPSSPHVDIPVHEGDTITATLTLNNKTYTAAYRAGGDNAAPIELALVEGGAAPPGPPPPPTPQPADGLTITPVPAAALSPPLEEGDVVRLDTAPGADNLIVLTPLVP